MWTRNTFTDYCLPSYHRIVINTIFFNKYSLNCRINKFAKLTGLGDCRYKYFLLLQGYSHYRLSLNTEWTLFFSAYFVTSIFTMLKTCFECDTYEYFVKRIISYAENCSGECNVQFRLLYSEHYNWQIHNKIKFTWQSHDVEIRNTKPVKTVSWVVSEMWYTERHDPTIIR